MIILVARVIAIENDNSFKLRRQSLLSKFHLVTLTESPTLHLPIPIVICYFTFPQEGVLPVQTNEPTPANENPHQPKGSRLLGRMVSLVSYQENQLGPRKGLSVSSGSPRHLHMNIPKKSLVCWLVCLRQRPFTQMCKKWSVLRQDLRPLNSLKFPGHRSKRLLLLLPKCLPASERW